MEIAEALDVERVRLRIGDHSTGIGAILGSVIGDPNGQIRGWPGDIRVQIDNPTIWQKMFGEGDDLGWVELEAGGFAAAITALQLQVAQLDADLTALSAQVGANTAAIAVLQGQIAVLQAQIAVLQAQIASLQTGVVARFDFTNMGNINLTTGAHVLTSVEGINLTFTSLQQGTTFDILQGTGLRFIADATITSFTLATRTAAHLLVLLGDLYTALGLGCDRDLSFTMFCSVLTIPNAQAAPAGVGLAQVRQANMPVNPGAASVHGYRRHNAAGSQALGSFTDNAANTNNYTNPAVVANTKVLGLNLAEGAMGAFAADWDTGLQTWDQVVPLRKNTSFVETTTANQVWKDQSCQVAMFFGTGNANANTVVTVEQLVIRSL